MNGINGIIVDGAVYELDPNHISCAECDLNGECFTRSLETACLEIKDGDGIFKLSQTLTNKLREK